MFLFVLITDEYVRVAISFDGLSGVNFAMFFMVGKSSLKEIPTY